MSRWAVLKSENPEVLMPLFNYYTLFRAFTNRMCEAEMNPKIMMETLGHADISTAINIYADVSEEFSTEEFKGFGKYYDISYNKLPC